MACTRAPVLFASFALRDGMEQLFTALLSGAKVNTDATVAIAGLGASSSRMRVASYLLLAGRGTSIASERLPARTAAESLEERISLHLFEASQGALRTEPLATLVMALAADPDSKAKFWRQYLTARASIRGLSVNDRAILLGALDAKKEEIDLARGRKFEGSAADKPAKVSEGASPVVKTLSGYPPGFLRSVLDATGCVGREGSFDGADAVFRPGGRAVSVTPLKSAASAN